MSVLVNILDTYYMAGLWEGLSPVPSFFRDRYFPTGAGDIYAANKVLVEYRDGDNAMAPFMVMGEHRGRACSKAGQRRSGTA